MEKNMETMIMGFGFIVFWVYIGENGNENGNYYSILGLYRENLNQAIILSPYNGESNGK